MMLLQNCCRLPAFHPCQSVVLVPVPLSPAEISQKLGGNCRIWGKVKKIRTLALVGGSGFDPELLEEAKSLDADAFLSAEMKHSVARIAPLPCIEATHYALEAPAMQRLSIRMGWQYIDDPPHMKIIP